jgi:hypothetical protein
MSSVSGYGGVLEDLASKGSCAKRLFIGWAGVVIPVAQRSVPV